MSNANKKSAKQIISIIGKIVEWIIIGILIICLLSLLAQRLTGQTPSLFGYTTYTVLTDSMSGTYEVGDVVICKREKEADPNLYKEGDVIAFIAPRGFDEENKLEGYTVTHRISRAPFAVYDEKTGEEQWYVTTRGDMMQIDDKVNIPIENIQGKIVGTSRFISKMAKFLSKWYGFVIVVVIPLLTVLIWQITIYVKEKVRFKEDTIKKEKEKEIREMLEKKKQQEEEIKKKAIEEYLENNK